MCTACKGHHPHFRSARGHPQARTLSNHSHFSRKCAAAQQDIALTHLQLLWLHDISMASSGGQDREGNGNYITCTGPGITILGTVEVGIVSRLHDGVEDTGAKLESVGGLHVRCQAG